MPKLSVKLSVRLMTTRKKTVGSEQRKLDVAHAAQQPGAVHRRRLDQRLRDRLQRRQEEDEVVADVFPGEGDDDADHRVDAVERRVPQARPDVVDEGHEAGLGRQDEAECHAERRRRDGERPDQHGAVDAPAAQLAVGEERQDQRDRHGERRCSRRRRRCCRQIEFQ